MKRELKITEDGSSTVFIEEMDETYHSSHGAIQEAQHVFINNGIKNCTSSSITIFEMGLGTGLNALLTAQNAAKNQINIHYVGIEAFPVEQELVNQLNYTDQIGGVELFNAIHSAKWGRMVTINPFFSLEKVEERIEHFNMPSGKFDLIYYDAFGPRAQASMWEMDVLSKMYEGLKLGGELITYCAQGQFKRNLKQLGFKVESLPGPPGKREMTRAIKL